MIVKSSHVEYVKKHYPIGKRILSAGMPSAYHVTGGWQVVEHVEDHARGEYLIKVQKMVGNRLMTRVHDLDQLRSFRNMAGE